MEGQVLNDARTESDRVRQIGHEDTVSALSEIEGKGRFAPSEEGTDGFSACLKLHWLSINASFIRGGHGCQTPRMIWFWNL